MVPLYSARIEDLKPGDTVVIQCEACGHTVAIPHTGLVHGLRLPPAEKVLDLAPRLRCRECDARGKAIVSIRWKATSRNSGLCGPYGHWPVLDRTNGPVVMPGLLAYCNRYVSLFRI